MDSRAQQGDSLLAEARDRAGLGRQRSDAVVDSLGRIPPVDVAFCLGYFRGPGYQLRVLGSPGGFALAESGQGIEHESGTGVGKPLRQLAGRFVRADGHGFLLDDIARVNLFGQDYDGYTGLLFSSKQGAL